MRFRKSALQVIPQVYGGDSQLIRSRCVITAKTIKIVKIASQKCHFMTANITIDRKSPRNIGVRTQKFNDRKSSPIFVTC